MIVYNDMKCYEHMGGNGFTYYFSHVKGVNIHIQISSFPRAFE